MEDARNRIRRRPGDIEWIVRAAQCLGALRVAGGAASPPGAGPAAELRRSLAIEAGLAPPDWQWAVGYAWRALYPTIVEQLSGDEIGADRWPRFRRFGAKMERLAFGPPPLNAAKLLALIQAEGGIWAVPAAAGASWTARSTLCSLGPVCAARHSASWCVMGTRASPRAVAGS